MTNGPRLRRVGGRDEVVLDQVPARPARRRSEASGGRRCSGIFRRGSGSSCANLASASRATRTRMSDRARATWWADVTREGSCTVCWTYAGQLPGPQRPQYLRRPGRDRTWPASAQPHQHRGRIVVAAERIREAREGVTMSSCRVRAPTEHGRAFPSHCRNDDDR